MQKLKKQKQFSLVNIFFSQNQIINSSQFNTQALLLQSHAITRAYTSICQSSLTVPHKRGG